MPLRDPFEALQRTFGFDNFRPHQEEIVQAILAGRDVFAALPTGGGKSLCYQLPAVLLDGLTVVVSPLIALMKDQVDAAVETGLSAAFLNSSLDREGYLDVVRRLDHHEVDLLYVSPERLALEEFRARLHDWGAAFFAVDEAHCISEWGHEFRPDYRRLSMLRDEFPAAILAGFTATATPRVQQDVVEHLHLRNPLIVRASFDRPEIFYRVVRKRTLRDQILSFVKSHDGEAGIVYRTSRKDVEATAGYLAKAGIRCRPYHAGLPEDTRRENQEAFVRDEVDVVVATIAFGMGIDKSNVRWIVHGDLPRSVEGYYQETGRAGRDGLDADTCLFYGPGDLAKIRWFIGRMEDNGEAARAERNLRAMAAYSDSIICRRTALLAHFGEDHSGNCGRCDVCTGEVQFVDRTEDARKVLSAVARTGERFGAHHVADVLAGNETDKVLQHRHNELPTFGVGAGESKSWWLDVIKDLEATGGLVRDEARYNALAITDKGREILFGRDEFSSIVRPKPAGGKRARRAKGGALSSGEPTPAEETLFGILREKRTDIARDRHVPPYVIFSDKSLREMARLKPVDDEAFLLVHGVGERKLQEYGELFMASIRRFTGMD